MPFDSLGFLLFFAVVYAIYWRVRSDEARRQFLCAASVLFYAFWDWRYVGLIVFVAAVAFWTVRQMRGARDPRARKRWLTLGIAAQLSVLAFFKYADFFIGSLAGVAKTMGWSAEPALVQILLPVGISFYTFHAISYAVDVHRNKVDVEPRFSRLLLYLAFFPQLVAGPIVRASFFLPQIRSTRCHDPAWLAEGLRSFAVGFVFKTVVADNLARLADPVFADPQQWTSSGLWVGVLAYYGQIYFDFAGYSLMAIGLALWLGYRLPDNFAWPYSATSVTDFWRRWHISLSTFLRDYLYIPLGGSRNGRWLLYRNLMITMVLGGLWHGASWNFVAWGALHGIALVVHKIWSDALGERTAKLPGALLGWTITQLWVLLAWVFFRAQNWSDAGVILNGMLRPVANATQSYPWWLALFVLLPVAVDAAIGRWKSGAGVFAWPAYVFAIFFGVAAAAALWLRPLTSAPFIYFQF